MKFFLVKILLLFILILLTKHAIAQSNEIYPVWIYLKPEYIFDNSNKIQYSQKTLQRLNKIKWRDNVSDYLPTETLKKQIEEKVINIRHYSRSLCAFSANIEDYKYNQLMALPFVKEIKRVRTRKKPRVKLPSYPAVKSLSKTTDFYGNSREQLEQLNVIKVHEMGITGKNVRIAVIDAGFRKDHESFEYIMNNQHLIEEHDFINNDGNVQDESVVDTVNGSRQQEHGTAVLSCIAGYVPNKIVGPAFDSEILLAKTEVEGSETRIEEDYFVAAVEWAEAKGADIISSSLGYRDFDYFEYPFSHLDGKTAEQQKLLIGLLTEELYLSPRLEMMRIILAMEG